MVIRLFLIFVFVITSCSVKEKKQCGLILKETKEYQNSIPENYEAKGNVYIQNIPAIFKAKFSNNEGKIKFYTIFGQKIGQINKNNENICISFKNIRKCGNKEVYKDLLNLDIPNKLKNILIGKTKIPENANYYCKDNKLFVKDKDIIYTFENGKLKQIIYNNYKVVYKYKDSEIFIEIFDKKEKKAKIHIRNLRKLE